MAKITLDPGYYYKDYCKIPVVAETQHEIYTRCPFHQDDKRSFSISKKPGKEGLCHCQGACNRGWNLVQFHTQFFKVTEYEAELDLALLSGQQKIVQLEEVKKRHEVLLRNNELLQYLKQKRGYKDETIKERLFGFDGDRLWIPIIHRGKVVNVRKHDWRGAHPGFKSISYGEGFGRTRLWPLSSLKEAQTVYLFEGEPDCILAVQMGLPALTVSGSGSGSWQDEFNPVFKDRNVILVYDVDPAGKKGAQAIAQKLLNVAKTIKVVELPVSTPNKDFTDYIIGLGNTIDDFNSLVEATAPMLATALSGPVDSTVTKVSLQEASDKHHFYKHVEIPVIVSGKDTAPFFAPKKVKMSCDMSKGKACHGCGLFRLNGDADLEFFPDSPDLLKLVGCTDDQQKWVLKRRMGIPDCFRFEMKVTEAMTVELLRVIPEIDHIPHTNLAEFKDHEYVSRSLYVVGHGMQSNRSYRMTGLSIPHPKTQYATAIVYNAIPNQLSIDSFEMTPELAKEIRSVMKGTTKEIIEDFCNDIADTVTHIYERNDLIRAIDMSYHSVLQFKFRGKLIRKGWAECLILGDPRCGKSETLENLMLHYGLGEIVTGENTSYAGLIGGMQQMQDHWAISWGKLPLNDRRLLAIDEFSALSDDILQKLSGVRSSGVAEITKIQTEKTLSRTRLIVLSNTRTGRPLKTYNHGVIAVKELIGKGEDIARFDFAITVASGEVSLDAVHRKPQIRPSKYSSRICNALVLWAWSRKPDQVEFEESAEELILKSVDDLAKEYSSSIPLVEPAEQRIKIARLSVAVAARVFSCDATFQKVVVKKEHVEEVLGFLHRCYKSPSMEYHIYSKTVNKGDELSEERFQKLFEEIGKFQDWPQIRDLFLELQMFRKSEFMDQSGYDPDQAKDLFKFLSFNKLIRSTPVGFVKEPAFTQLLKKSFTAPLPTKPTAMGSPKSVEAVVKAKIKPPAKF